MTYALGLDLGTTDTAAAVWRAGTAEMVGLGTHGHVIPSVVHLRDDGQLITGEAAVRRSLTEPGRTGREFKRRLGGVDFDHAVIAHVERQLADALAGMFAEVRLTRREFETMIARALIEPMRAFNRALASAGVTSADIHTVLLVGGSSRVPLVAETFAGTLGRPVAVVTHPKYAVALGAARIIGIALAAQEASTTPLPAPAPLRRRHTDHPTTPSTTPGTTPSTAAPTTDPSTTPTSEATNGNCVVLPS